MGWGAGPMGPRRSRLGAARHGPSRVCSAAAAAIEFFFQINVPAVVVVVEGEEDWVGEGELLTVHRKVCSRPPGILAPGVPGGTPRALAGARDGPSTPDKFPSTSEGYFRHLNS